MDIAIYDKLVKKLKGKLGKYRQYCQRDI